MINKTKASKYHYLKPILVGPILLGFLWIHIYAINNIFHFSQEYINHSNDPFLTIIYLSTFFPSIGYSLLFMNTIFYLIPPIRNKFEYEAKKGIISKPIINKSHKNFKESQKELLKLTCKYLIPIGYSITIISYILKIKMQ